MQKYGLVRLLTWCWVKKVITVAWWKHIILFTISNRYLFSLEWNWKVGISSSRAVMGYYSYLPRSYSCYIGCYATVICFILLTYFCDFQVFVNKVVYEYLPTSLVVHCQLRAIGDLGFTRSALDWQLCNSSLVDNILILKHLHLHLKHFALTSVTYICTKIIMSNLVNMMLLWHWRLGKVSSIYIFYDAKCSLAKR